MNKYQKALKWVKSIHDVIGQEEYYQDLGLRFGQGLHESIETIKELVDKETPMKPYHSENGYRRCGRCHLILKSTIGIPFRYCSFCGQRVGGSNDDEH